MLCDGLRADRIGESAIDGTETPVYNTTTTTTTTTTPTQADEESGQIIEPCRGRESCKVSTVVAGRRRGEVVTPN